MEEIIHIKVNLACDVHHAFRMFTENLLLEKWLTTQADVIPEIGGKYELFWIRDNREINNTAGCKITGIEQDSFISFDWKGPEEYQAFMNNCDPLTHVIVTFSKDNENNVSIVHLFHTGWRQGEEWEKARLFFVNAWTNVLQSLEEMIEKKEL